MIDYSKMFKAYDVRATVPDLSAEVYYLTGFAFVEKILKPNNLPLSVNVGHDTRYSSPDFYKAICHGINAAGGKAVPIGLASTDMMYASVFLTKTAGIQVTASHNPKDDNGIKIVKSGSEMLGLNNGLDLVRDYVVEKIVDFKLDLENLPPAFADVSVIFGTQQLFIEKVRQIGKIEETNKLLKERSKTLKIVVDTGNGMGGMVMEKIKDLFSNVEWIPLYWDLDGNFPNHPADPSNKKNLVDISQKILETKADFGAAFDGDADRCYILDEKGELIKGDFMVAKFAEIMLKSLEADTKFSKGVVYPLAASRCIPDTIKACGGVAIPSPMGHTNMKLYMEKEKACYGGEHSGHHYFGEFGNMDTGAVVLALFINSLVNSSEAASNFATPLPAKYFLSGEINFKIDSTLTIAKIKEKLKAKYAKAKFDELDGISVFFPDFKINVRFSNTEPLLRLNVETIGKNNVQAKVEEVMSVLGLKKKI